MEIFQINNHQKIQSENRVTTEIYNINNHKLTKMKHKPLVIMLGERFSGKEYLFEKLTHQQSSERLLDMLEPYPIKQGKEEQQIYLMNTPDCISINNKIQFFLLSIKDFLLQFSYSLVSIILLFKYHKEVDQTIDRCVILLRKAIIKVNEGIKLIIAGCEEQKEQSEFRKRIQQKYKLDVQFLPNIKNQFESNWIQNLMVINLTESINFFFSYLNSLPNNNNSLKTISNQLVQIWSQNFKSEQCIHLRNFLKEIIYRSDDEIIDQNILFQLSSNELMDIFSNLIYLYSQLHYQVFYGGLSLSYRLYSTQQKTFLSGCTQCLNCNLIYFFEDQRMFCFTKPCRFQYSIIQVAQASNQLCVKCKYKLQYDYSSLHYQIQNIILTKCLTQFYEMISDVSKKQQISNKQLKNEIKECESFDLNDEQKEKDNNVEFKKQKGENEQNQNYLKTQDKKYLVGILLSCEGEQKSVIFQKAISSAGWLGAEKQGQFRKSTELKNFFFLVDSPCFSFTEESKETKILLFKEYFCSQQVHFIFLCLEYQRTDLMKERLNSMLKKLSKINRKKMSIIITNWERCEEQSEILGIKNMAKAKSIDQVIFFKQDELGETILERCYDCLINSDAIPISFSGTMFAEETEQEKIETKILNDSLTKLTGLIQKDQEVKVTKVLEQISLSLETIQNEITQLEQSLEAKRKQKKQLISDKSYNESILQKIKYLNSSNLDTQVIKETKFN